jgi:hypothetical protein
MTDDAFASRTGSENTRAPMCADSSHAAREDYRAGKQESWVDAQI